MVKGTVDVRTDETISSMRIGEIKHIDMDDIFFLKNVIYIDKGTQTFDIPIDDDDDEYDEFGSCYVLIKRTGKGLTQDDFVLDFSEFKIILRPMRGIFWNIIQKTLEDYIQFSGFKIIDKSSKQEKTPEEKLTILKNNLKTAEDNQKFERAAKIKVEIEALEREISKNK